MRMWEKLGLTEDDMISLEDEILRDPDAGDTVAGTGGMKKIRFARKLSNKGKSGSHRAMYLYLEAYGTIFFVILFDKRDKDNITQAEANALAKYALILKEEEKRRHDAWRRQIEKRPRRS
jgi:hypothetical protein